MTVKCSKCGSGRQRNLVVFYDNGELDYKCLYCLLGADISNKQDVHVIKKVSDWLIVGSEWFDDNHIPVIQQEQLNGILQQYMRYKQ